MPATATSRWSSAHDPVLRLLRHHRHPRHHPRARRSAAPASGTTPSTDEAITDALRLARGMTYKSAVAGLNLGGGKSVIIGDNKRTDREALFRAHGRFVEIARRPLHHRRGRRHQPGRHGVHQAGDRARRRAARPLGRSVAGHGVRRVRRDEGGGQGALGQRQPGGQDGGGAGLRATSAYYLCSQLHAEGAKLIVTDIDAGEGEAGGGRVRRHGGRARTRSTTRRPTSTPPARSGATINDDTLPRLKVEIVAGGANNQLAEERHGDALEQRGILYAPDYVINGGGVINVYGELHGWPARAGQEQGAARSTTRCSGSSTIAKRDGSRPTTRPTGWPRSGSRRWRAGRMWMAGRQAARSAGQPRTVCAALPFRCRSRYIRSDGRSHSHRRPTTPASS